MTSNSLGSWYKVEDLEKRLPSVSLARRSSFFPLDDDDDDDCRVIDGVASAGSPRAVPTVPLETQAAPSTAEEKPLMNFLGQNFEFYAGDVLADFAEEGRFIRSKVGKYFVPFDTIYLLSRNEGRRGQSRISVEN